MYRVFLYMLAAACLILAVPALFQMGAFIIGILPIILVALAFVGIVLINPFKWG